MIYKKIMLDEEAWLEAYISDPVGNYVRNAILVIPGGGYWGVCSDREGEPIAQAFIPYGYNAFVLHYSVGKDGKGRNYPLQLIQASLAIKHIRDCAEEYRINPKKVFVTGFSAGGHLAGSLGILWHRQEIYDAIEMPYGYNRPDGMMLVYPVISGEPECGHIGSFKNLLGMEEPAGERLENVSLEKWVDEKSAPLYLIHTSNDQVVNVMNAVVLARAYAKAGKLFEMHVYPDAPHGVALGNDITECGQPKWNNPCIGKWIENAVAWAKQLEK